MNSYIIKKDLGNGIYITIDHVTYQYCVNAYLTNTDNRYIGITDLLYDYQLCGNDYNHALDIMTVFENKYSKKSGGNKQ